MAKRYDHTKTRLWAVRDVLRDAAAETQGVEKIYSNGIRPGNMKLPAIMIGLTPTLGASRRVPNTLDDDWFEWTDKWAMELHFQCPTDKEGALEEASAIWSHRLEKALYDYEIPSTAVIDTDEIEVVAKSIDVQELMTNVVWSKDHGAVRLFGEITTGIEWK